MDDNIFDDDEALDYIIYEDCEKKDTRQNNAGGCLSTILILLIPLASIAIAKIANKFILT